MTDVWALLQTDIVESTLLTEPLGATKAAALWAAHDHMARGLIHHWGGREIERSDGFIVTFDAVADAAGFALDYHEGLRTLEVPLQARAGLHVAPLTLVENTPADMAIGAMPMEVRGLALAVTARLISVAGAGQTLLTAEARAALGATALQIKGHGHWRLKGLREPVELFGVGRPGATLAPPPDAPKAFRVVRKGDNWLPVAQLRHSLPAERDRFIGRAEVLGELVRHFECGARLVSVLGIGGIGKTRLVQRFGWTYLGEFPGGVWFCDLSQATTFEGLMHAVAHGLDLPLGKGDPVAQLGAAIDGRGACLVILDNFEQVARLAESTVGQWLDRAARARFIVTTREVLGIVGEQGLALAPLPSADGTQLFVQRAAAAKADFDPTADDMAAIEKLVQLLDGLPLAIELAAARVRVMPPRLLLTRMSERFKVLTSRGGRVDRQATLQAAFDWSWGLLAPGEKAALAQLSVFEGSFTLAAAEEVLDFAEVDATASAMDLVQSLVQKSLIRQVGDHRFGLLASVKEYAADHLRSKGRFPGSSPDAMNSAQARHGRYYSALDERDAAADRCVDLDNLVAACTRAAKTGNASVAVHALAGAWAALRLTGPFGTAVDLGKAVETSMPAGDPQRAIVDRVVGAALSLLGDVAGSRVRYLSAIRVAAHSGDTVTQARAQCLLAELELSRGDTDAATALLRDAEQSPAGRTDSTVRYMCLNGLGKLHTMQSRWSEARSCYAEALTLAESLGNRRWQGGLQGNLGMIARAEGRRQDARRHWETGLGLASEVGDRQWAGNTHCNLGLILHDLGEDDAAAGELRTALDIARQLGHRRLEATALCNLGLVAEARGDNSAACDHHANAAQIAEAVGDHRLEGQARGYLGLSMAMLSHHDRAFAELDRAQTLLRPYGDPSAMALVLLQSAVASAARGDTPGAHAYINGARDWMTPLTDNVDPEVTSMLARAERAVALPRPQCDCE